MTSVFCTSTSTPMDGSTRDSASTASTAWKKVPPPPPNGSGISIPITPRSNSLSMSSRGIFACSSIDLARRTDLPVGELVHAVAEQPLVVSQLGQRGVRGVARRGRHRA